MSYERISDIIKSLGIHPEDEHFDIAYAIIHECAEIVREHKRIDWADSIAISDDILENFGIER